MEKAYKSLKLEQKSPGSRVFHLYINRPSRGNALSPDFFTEFPAALSALDQNPDVAVIILSGAGKHFCTGIDLQSLGSSMFQIRSSDTGRTAEGVRRHVLFLQRAVTAIEECRKPVLAAVHGACLGGGIDLITACDIRYCTQDSSFSVKEVDVAITADLGTLQRLPNIIGFGNAMELALTARKFSGSEAKEMGLVTMAYSTKEAMETGVAKIAEGIAAKSPLAIVGTKRVMLQSRNLTVEQGLDYVATWNSGLLLSDDLEEVLSAQQEKRKPLFAKL